MKIVFFETQDWEKEILKNNFPEAVLTEDKLSADNVGSYKDAEAISIFIYSKVDKAVIDNMPNLKFIATRSTGFDHIDIQHCKTKNITVSSVPEYGTHTVAEHTFALILNLTRKIYQSVNQAKVLNFDHHEIRGVDLNGKTVGIIGFGKIGKAVATIAKGFGLHILVHNRTQDLGLSESMGFKYADLETLIKNSDIITLHCALTPETRHIINKENILLFKKGSYLINTSRGGLIDTQALVMGLQQGIIEGVGLDVLEEEKPLSEEVAILTSKYKSEANIEGLVYDFILINNPKVLITPHNAFNSKEALDRILETTIENIKGFFAGKPGNVIS